MGIQILSNGSRNLWFLSTHQQLISLSLVFRDNVKAPTQLPNNNTFCGWFSRPWALHDKKKGAWGRSSPICSSNGSMEVKRHAFWQATWLEDCCFQQVTTWRSLWAGILLPFSVCSRISQLRLRNGIQGYNLSKKVMEERIEERKAKKANKDRKKYSKVLFGLLLSNWYLMQEKSHRSSTNLSRYAF